MKPQIASVYLIVCLLSSTAQADPGNHGNIRKHHVNKEEERLAAPDDDAVIYHNNEGHVVNLSSAYSPSIDYGDKVNLHLNNILRSESNLVALQHLRTAPPSKDRNIGVINAVDLINEKLVQELLALARNHKDEWHKSLDNKSDQEEIAKDREAIDHFRMAENAYEASLDVCRQLWRIMQRGVLNDRHLMFSLSKRTDMSSIQAYTHRALAELWQKRCESERPNSVLDNCSGVHRHLVKSDGWYKQTLLQYNIDLDKQNSDWIITKEHGESPESHKKLVKELMKASAHMNEELGSFLIEMFEENLTLGTDMRLHEGPPTSAPEVGAKDGTYLGDGHKRILSQIVVHLSITMKIYDALSTDEDYRKKIADANYHRGFASAYLYQWDKAADQLHKSVFVYEMLSLKTIQGSRESMDLAFNAVQATKSLWEAFLNLPGKTESAKQVYHLHLAFHRYFETRVKLDSPLTNDGEGEDNKKQNQGNDESQTYYKAHAGEDLPFEEELVAYHSLLNEYLEDAITLRTDYTSYFRNDRVFEGRLRSAIGALHLSQNQRQAATVELVLAVGHLRDGLLHGRDYFKSYNGNGEIMENSVQLELANALLNLAFALLLNKNWRTSYRCFEEAMDIYDMELGEDESPMNNPGMGVKGKRKGHPVMWQNYVKEEANASVFSQYLKVGDLPVIGNSTDTKLHWLEMM